MKVYFSLFISFSEEKKEIFSHKPKDGKKEPYPIMSMYGKILQPY